MGSRLPWLLRAMTTRPSKAPMASGPDDVLPYNAMCRQVPSEAVR
jgi:hypothetical protein